MPTLSSRFKVPREKLQYAYSVAVLVVVPVLIIINTFVIVTSTRHNFDTELRRKANLANSLIADAVGSSLTSPKTVQTAIQHMAVDNTELQHIYVVVPEASTMHNFKVIASSDTQMVNQSIDTLQYELAQSKQQPVAVLLSNSPTDRYWSVVTPVVKDSAVPALVASQVSLKQADELTSNTLFKSLGVLIVTTILVVLLLLNHFRFFEYALLFRKLKELDQMKTDFLSVATHELRAPMTVIKGTIENVQTGVFGPIDNKAAEALGKAFSETDRLTNLVNDLLNVSRLEQGRISYDMKTIDSREAVDFIVNEFEPKAKEKGLELTYTKPAEPMMIRVDTSRLMEIMTNLVDNAIKYSLKGSIKVTHRQVDGKVRIAVRDTGIGMSASERENLFSRFYRIRNDKTKDIGGTGLGLWIIKQYLEAMHGHIHVDSLEGEGSEFSVEFPVASKPLTDVAPPKTEAEQ